MSINHKTSIGALRDEIDAIDKQILELINQRISIAIEIGKAKKQTGTQVVDNARELALIKRLLALNKGLLKNNALRRIFHDIITASREAQRAEAMPSLGPDSQALFCVFGDPVAHSLSPVMHNRAFAYTGYNGLYMAFKVSDISQAIAGMRVLGIKGASITMPHKINVMGQIDEIDAMARDIGAVNTVVNQNGVLKGYNTDCHGASAALLKKTEIANRNVAILGAGGAARAIGFGIIAEGGKVTIFNRSKDKGEALAGVLNASFCPLAEIKTLDCDILINTTSVGMSPHVQATPISKKLLAPEMVVMDIVYNPIQTQLLKDAKMLGCTIVQGVDMFVYQGASQFKLWTGKNAPVEIMKKAVLGAINEDKPKCG